ncbi:hypothetical protein ACFFJN_04230, partial [Erwinia mallotivora]|uniref:hypothetical protein n=1 Tax=Erwinia mallotivora TaxID=69222 RepID=UPI0035EA61C1
PEFIANLPFTACHTLPSEIIVMHYTITPFGMSSKSYLLPVTPTLCCYVAVNDVRIYAIFHLDVTGRLLLVYTTPPSL